MIRAVADVIRMNQKVCEEDPVANNYDALLACCEVMYEFLQPCHALPFIG